MKIKILRVPINELVDAIIRKGEARELPSIHTGWRFNFDKHIRKLSHARAYVVVCEDSPDIIEGCMIFQMKNGELPYLAYLETAPHNRKKPAFHTHVAGCLIAYAFKLSVLEGKGDHQSILALDVLESDAGDQLRLMHLYSTKYRAIRASDTRMYIMDNDGHALVKEYLGRT